LASTLVARINAVLQFHLHSLSVWTDIYQNNEWHIPWMEVTFDIDTDGMVCPTSRLPTRQTPSQTALSSLTKMTCSDPDQHKGTVIDHIMQKFYGADSFRGRRFCTSGSLVQE
jgi:hypothetical protein